MEFQLLEYTATEGQTFRYCVDLNGVIDVARTVRVQLGTGGSAQANADFQFAPVTITFEPNSNTRMCRSLIINIDQIIEPVENFFLTLAGEPSGVSIPFRDTEVVVMDATQAQITYLNSSSVSVTEGASVQLCFMLPLIFVREVSIQVALSPPESEF